MLLNMIKEFSASFEFESSYISTLYNSRSSFFFLRCGHRRL